MGNVGKRVSWLILKIEMGHLGGWDNGPHGQCGHVLDHVQLPSYCMDLYKNFTAHRY